MAEYYSSELKYIKVGDAVLDCGAQNKTPKNETFDERIYKTFEPIWNYEINHPEFQETVGELMEEVIAIYNKQKETGEWIFIGDNMFECSCCAYVNTLTWLSQWRLRTSDSILPKMCPRCGAKLVTN